MKKYIPLIAVIIGITAEFMLVMLGFKNNAYWSGVICSYAAGIMTMQLIDIIQTLRGRDPLTRLQKLLEEDYQRRAAIGIHNVRLVKKDDHETTH